MGNAYSETLNAGVHIMQPLSYAPDIIGAFRGKETFNFSTTVNNSIEDTVIAGCTQEVVNSNELNLEDVAFCVSGDIDIVQGVEGSAISCDSSLDAVAMSKAIADAATKVVTPSDKLTYPVVQNISTKVTDVIKNSVSNTCSQTFTAWNTQTDRAWLVGSGTWVSDDSPDGGRYVCDKPPLPKANVNLLQNLKSAPTSCVLDTVAKFMNNEAGKADLVQKTPPGESSWFMIILVVVIGLVVVSVGYFFVKYESRAAGGGLGGLRLLGRASLPAV